MRRTLAVLAATVSVLLAPVAAQAADGTVAEINQALVAETGAVETAPTPDLSVTSDGITLGEVNIGLPTAGTPFEQDGMTLFEGQGAFQVGVFEGQGAFQVGVLPTGDAVRALVNIDSADAPERYDFPVSGDVTSLEFLGEGSVLARDAADETVGVFAAPWARDASGMSVPTHFEITGTQLTQVVEHLGSGAEYGVTADPFWIPAAVIVGRCVTNRYCRYLLTKDYSRAIDWAVRNLFG